MPAGDDLPRPQSTNSAGRFSLPLLFIPPVLWGTFYFITKVVTQTVPIFFFLGIRHLVALLGFFPFFAHLRHIDRKTFGMAFVTGGANFCVNAFQAFGLQSINSGTSGFLSGLSVVFVPILAWMIFRRSISRKIWIAALISFMGMGVMVLTGTGMLAFQFNLGEGLTVGAALFGALQIIYTERYAPKVDILQFSMLQMTCISGLSFMCSVVTETWQGVPINALPFWGIVIYMGVAVTTYPFLCQNYGQRYQPASRVAVIFALEPVFATFFGILGGDTVLTIQILVGGSLILLANFLAIYHRHSTLLPSLEADQKTPVNSAYTNK